MRTNGMIIKICFILGTDTLKANNGKYYYFMSNLETKDLFVPCRPTNNDVNVTLRLMKGGTGRSGIVSEP